MKARNELFNEVTDTVSRLVKSLAREKAVDQESRNAESQQNPMQRVTDEMGNEYLCPVNRLDNKNFVSESEKIHCFDYNLIAGTPQA